MHWRSMRRASGKDNASRRAPKARKGVHQLGLMGLMERENTAVDISTPFHGEGDTEFQDIACLLHRSGRQRLNLCFHSLWW